MLPAFRGRIKYWGHPWMAMNYSKLVLYVGSIILLIIGIYTIFTGETSPGIVWVLLGVIFFSVSLQIGQPIKGIRIRRRVILVCAIFLLLIGVYVLYLGQILPGIVWIVSGILGLLITSMLKEKKLILDPQ
jgi:hypothetical protein